MTIAIICVLSFANFSCSCSQEGKNVDEETGKKLAPIYCKVCKLVFHQKRIEHNASEMHRLINDFLNPRCSSCDTDYFSPMAYERHIATLQHIKVGSLS